MMDSGRDKVPNKRGIRPLLIKRYNKIRAPIAIGKLLFKISFFATIGVNTALIHKINSKVVRLLQIIFPNANQGVWRRFAPILTTNSGSDVPIATIVNPIKISEIRSLLAIFEAPSMSISAHLTRNIKPNINNAYNIRKNLHMVNQYKYTQHDDKKQLSRPGITVIHILV